MVGVHAHLRSGAHLPGVRARVLQQHPGQRRRGRLRLRRQTFLTRLGQGLRLVPARLAALLHGTNGLRYSVEDMFQRPGRRFWAKTILFTVAGIVFVLGVMTLWAFSFEEMVEPFKSWESNTVNRAHRYDVLVVGAGGAGLMAARYAAQNPNVSVAVISKLYPTRSHTGAAHGGDRGRARQRQRGPPRVACVRHHQGW